MDYIYQAKRIIDKYKFDSKSIVSIPFSEFSFNSIKEISWFAQLVKDNIVSDIDWQFLLCYNEQKILYYDRSSIMKSTITMEIPYGKRNEYIDFLFNVNKLINNDGLLTLFVNNNPYSLCAYLVIETSQNIDEIKKLISDENLTTVTDKGFNELFNEQLRFRKYNSCTFPCNCNKATIEQFFRNCFLFAEENELLSKGFIKKSIERKKVFISYCHKNNDVVYSVIDEMELQGLNIWIDKKQIDVGDNILESVLSGINQSDLAVLFISKYTLKSHFSKLELNTIMSAMMKKKMGWYIVKIDDVNPDEIIPSLGDYKYFDLSSQNIDSLVNDIKKKILKI